MECSHWVYSHADIGSRSLEGGDELDEDVQEDPECVSASGAFFGILYY